MTQPIRAMRAALVLTSLLATGCTCAPAPTAEPQLLLGIRPSSATDDGVDVDVQVTATDAFAKPGKGDVVVSAPHGVFGNGQGSITLTLDAAGSAFTTFACDAHKDRDCFGSVVLSAVWGNVSTGVGTTTTDVNTTRKLGIVGCGFPEDAGQPPIVRRCAPSTADECAGPTDAFLAASGVALLNGSGGNGYDDDCDGLVDEGCACPSKGATKECWMVPPSQRDPATGVPAGWCGEHSKGSVDCSGFGSPVWSGLCRGAQPPSDHDTCSLGDFNCDGLQRNSDLVGCRCAIDINCPKTPMVLEPFPDPNNLTAVTAAGWFPDAGLVGATTNWRWTAIGGDCDNVLPNPTFTLYKGKDSSAVGGRIGIKDTVTYDTSFDPPRYLADPNSAVRAVRASAGDGVGGSVIFPAFSLSGDYLIQGEFDYGATHYACTQSVQVRAKGLRAELCWDTVGNNDVDLHFVRLQGTNCPVHGWNGICGQPEGEDCYFANRTPNWGMAQSPSTACHGWGSRQGGSGDAGCNNPRLDVDNVRCTTASEDPLLGDFCSPENINVDQPKDGDRFAVGVIYYGTSSTAPLAHPHVNLYCNGTRIMSAGYNSVTGQTFFPALRNTGASTGDTWTVATVTARVDAGVLVACDVEKIPSRHADSTRDGLPLLDAGTDDCVDSSANLSPAPFGYNIKSSAFIEFGSTQVGDAGDVPATRDDWCKH